MRCKFIIKLNKPFGFDQESKIPDSARRFFYFENTQENAGKKLFARAKLDVLILNLTHKVTAIQ